MALLTTSEPGYSVIRSFEGRSLKAYRDEVGVWTIGFGNTNFDAEVLGFEIKAGVTITAAQAEQLLRAAMTRRYEPAVRAAMGPDVTQPAYDAGGSFHYNTGAIKRASWVQSYVAKNLPAVHSQITQWNKAGGNVLAGLTRRRNREWGMISVGDYGPEGRQVALTDERGRPIDAAPGAQPGAPSTPAVHPPDIASAATGLMPWHQRMEDILGLYEYPGADINPCILAMAKQCGGNIAATYKNDATPWCSLTVNWCLVTTGFKGTGTLWALDNRKLGTRLDGPAVGAVATKLRDGGGHVFLVKGKTADGRIVGTGGNQRDMVCDEIFDPSVLQYNWPAGAPLPPKVGLGTLPVVESRPPTHRKFDTLPAANEHPALQGTVVPADLKGTPGMLHVGDKGPEVKDFQKALIATGYSVGKDGPDGDYGDLTVAAVKDFQRRHPQLEVTGIADPATRVALKRDADAKAKLKASAGKSGGTTVATAAADQATGGHLPTLVYVGLGLVIVGALCYIAWQYRDELRAMLKAKFK